MKTNMREEAKVILSPMRVENTKNKREHWSARHRRTKDQRYATYMTLRQGLGLGTYMVPLLVIVTRIAPRMLDEGDNLAVSLSPITDGVSDYLCGAYLRGQDRQVGLVFAYGQRRGTEARQYAVEITLCPLDTSVAGENDGA